ncbi:hypothetical protein SpAB1_17520 [Streptococcus pyogenes]|nr:hypothetical protein SpAB1_17520 [Streptococcus pyogenes]
MAGCSVKRKRRRTSTTKGDEEATFTRCATSDDAGKFEIAL